MRPCLKKKTLSQKYWAGGVAQSKGPEFKPPVPPPPPKKKKRKEKKCL
jgi:hypothetical protein